jgi:hypothetical protein
MDSDSIEEEVTRSNFMLLENHNLDIKGSMGLFKDKLPDLSAITPYETTTQPFLNSKCSSLSVFDRLASDTNRRANASMRVQDYRLMLELEYENSFLKPLRLSANSESQLISRLLSDSIRRKKNQETLEKLKKSESPCKQFEKWPAFKTDEVVRRLFVDKRSEIKKRDEVKKELEEKQVEILERIRERRHPKRKIDQKVMSRVVASPSPNCKCGISPKSPSPKRKWNDVKDIVEKLHRGSSFKGFGSARKIHGPRKKSVLEADDYLITLKAKGK